MRVVNTGDHILLLPQGKASLGLQRLVRQCQHLLLAMLPVEQVEGIP